MFFITIDRNKKTPLYLQIYQQIKLNIYDGQLIHQEKLISEKQFCEMYDVSNFIVKRAYKMLEEEHLVHKVKGKGVFVNFKKTLEINLAHKEYIPMPISRLYTYRLIYHAQIKQTSYLNKEWMDKSNEHLSLYRLLVSDHRSPIAFLELYMDKSVDFDLKDFLNKNDSFLTYFNDHLSLDATQTSMINAAQADEILVEALNIEPNSLTTVTRTFFKSEKLGNFCYIKTYYVAKYTLLKVSDL